MPHKVMLLRINSDKECVRLFISGSISAVKKPPNAKQTTPIEMFENLILA